MKGSMRIVLFGTSAFAVPVLEAVVGSTHQVIRCITQPDRPQGRGLEPQPSPVKLAAQRVGCPCEEPTDLRASADALRQLTPDVGVVVAYGRLIPRELFTVPRHGMLGVHPSLLPRDRGAGPIAWAILHGDSVTGVTTFRLNDQLDAGDIAMQVTEPIQSRDTALTLSQRLAARGGDVLVETLAWLERGAVAFRPQDERLATYARKLSKEDGRVDWTRQAVALDRLIRAMVPWPGSSTTWRGESLKLWSVSPRSDPGASGQPGQILAVDQEGIVVATGEGQVTLHELQLAGGRRMAARDFLLGHDLRVGEMLGQET
ncbi:MAG TPA: methionyl-tRNA formyltransferase [Candidatus Omnitrophica bacterium]|nr:MAG: methionyl-tRNA formyltransferase [Omnitrophica WOR_2 bacterium GWA2_63_20]OGX15947.1 MAG: methionyl-tRNA formyltransferase [Omnitrophica WOR_2 bacterium GWF2_63_9]OGX31502.1 MAG: methionyl-tRNA formyltransferase [Omnitrophica WOR_2 bacterium RIFCSPHIGHO2_12_FULL_64_13]OGX36614.1 MAG: methionyl-tRNA formyltransferase [Omnitrophica WOR_2 bacterium RIFCSPHIGHO2_02_FULL_63_39]OGX46355.1 MAG: methionyl-tRNA formyltransferase [Omnitrophica WOR_2 bacterium RIFCSPLOWO2_02_FULL_63_16]OGX47360.1